MRKTPIPLVYRALLELSLMRAEVCSLIDAPDAETARLLSRIEVAENLAARLLDEVERGRAACH